MKSTIYSDVKIKTDLTVKIGNELFDSFLSRDGGFVEGSAIFLTGTPGAGKTTLAVVLQGLLKNYITLLYSREMTASSVKLQMKKYAIEHKNAYVADSEMCPNFECFIEELNEVLPKVVIIDSLQFIMKEDYPNESAESCAFKIIQELRAWTTKNNAVLIIVGHVNKDGEFEGRNTIQHLFDSHLEMIFDKKKGTRIISWAKNRKGKVGNALYYEFGTDSIDFYTPEQFDAIKNKKSLEDYMIEMISIFVKSLDRNNENYIAFKKEFKKEIDKLYNSDTNLFDVNLECISILKKLLNKYNF